MTKTCRDCGESKALDEFYKHPENKDGRHGYCKVCHRARNKRWIATHPEQVRHLRIARYWATRDERVERARAEGKARGWSMRVTPEAKAAKDAVYRAVKNGVLVRPQTCPRCARTGVPIQAHHADYAKWLEVEWMCKWCHEAEHHGTGAWHPQTSVTVGAVSKP